MPQWGRYVEAFSYGAPKIRMRSGLVRSYGFASLKADDPTAAEVGITLSRENQGKGFASEALRKVLMIMFDEIRVERIEAVTDSRNLGSIALLRRMGMTQDKTEQTWFKGSVRPGLEVRRFSPDNPVMASTLYMVVEHFKDAAAIYRRFRERGRMAPDGLTYVSSWVDEKLERCYQLMETQDRALLDQWMANWSDLTDFEVYLVITSKEAAERMMSRT
jgi:hypothetical protein